MMLSCSRKVCKVAILLFMCLLLKDSYGSGSNKIQHLLPKESYPEKDTVIIVAFGNSVTAERKSVHQVYAQRLPDLLKVKGLATRVVNSGIPGSHSGRRADNDRYKIRHALDRFETDVLSYRPDIVIIGFGINDAAIDSQTPDGTSRIPLDKFRCNIMYMIKTLKGKDIGVILMTPNKLGASPGDFKNKRLVQYVKVIRRLSKEYHTGLVDNYKLFDRIQRRADVNYETFMLDSIHPNDKGHEMIAGKLTDEIVRFVRQKGKGDSRKHSEIHELKM
jgi:lysophospholipase L1-like esterase